MALEAIMASEAVGGNMHMDTRVIRVADFESKGQMTSEVIKRSPWPRRPLEDISTCCRLSVV